MLARLTAKAIFAVAAIAFTFFGVGLLGAALAAALVQALGTVGACAVAGALFLLPPLVWAVVILLSKPKKPKPVPPSGSAQVVRALLAAVAKETPWVAIVGAGVAGMAEMFLNRKKPAK